MSNKNDSIAKKIITGIAISVGGTIITEGFKLIKNGMVSTINIGEWDNAYNNINKLIYKMDEEKYNKFKSPTTNQDWCELSCDTTYFIKLKKKSQSSPTVNLVSKYTLFATIISFFQMD